MDALTLGIHVGTDALDAVWVSAGDIVGHIRQIYASHELDLVLQHVLSEPAPQRMNGNKVQPVDNIVFDIGDVIQPPLDRRATFVRIAPRAPIDRFHTPGISGWAHPDSEIVYCPGGHNAMGEELSEFSPGALTRHARTHPGQQQYIITSVGSLENIAHESVAADLLSDLDPAAEIEMSHTFFSNSMTVRERTSFLNASLLRSAEELSSVLGLNSFRAAPDARLYVLSADGGCMPLGQILTVPVHALHSQRASELCGAAHLLGIRTGSVGVLTQEDQYFGVFHDGVPAVGSHTILEPWGHVASPSIKTNTLDDDTFYHLTAPAGVVSTSSEVVPDLRGAPTRVLTSNSSVLRALGAAVAPLSAWVQQIVSVTSEHDLAEEIAAAEAQAHTLLIAAAASPSKVRIVESIVTPSSYETPSMLAMQVRAVAERSGGPAL